LVSKFYEYGGLQPQNMDENEKKISKNFSTAENSGERIE